MKQITVCQVHELFEWFGFETRNKYQILDENNQLIAYAAEQQKGFLGFIFRQYLGHWRRFDVHFFGPARDLLMIGHHPFRWFFQRMELTDKNGMYIGAMQLRFSLFHKRFDVEDSSHNVIMEVASPIWRFWTFTFMRGTKRIGEVKKRWSGLISETFTDKDNFTIEFADPYMQENEKKLLIAASIFIDLQYFEKKASHR